MMRLKDFQDEAIKELLYFMEKDRLAILDAPTGAGKTIILINFIDRLLDIKSNSVVVWFTPGAGELEEQSQDKMVKHITNRVTKTLDDVLVQGFNAKDTVFINWEKVTKDGNKALKEGERDNLADKVKKAKDKGLEFILIIDEEHRNDTKKAKSIIDLFDEVYQIRASATPDKIDGVNIVKVTEKQAIREGLISKAIHINEGLTENVDEVERTKILLNLAIKKQKEIQNSYIDEDKNINPMVLIQLPNKSSKDIETQTVEYIEDYLAEKGYTYGNKRVAKWLSDRSDKINITESDLGEGNSITDNNAEPIFLIMKQAISTGWDAPRAKILVKLREGMGETFTIQTIGRIRRMPEAKHYENEILDNCYLYTYDTKYTEGLKSSLKDYYRDIKEINLRDEYKEFITTKEIKVDKEFTIQDSYIYEVVREGLREVYNLKGVKENKEILEDKYGYTFGTKIYDSYVTGKVEEGNVESFSKLNRTNIEIEVSPHINGLDLQRALSKIDEKADIGYSLMSAITKKLFLTKSKSHGKILSLSLREYYAFMINNQYILRDIMQSVLEKGSKLVGVDLIDTKEYIEKNDFKLPDKCLFEYDKTIKSAVVYDKNVYDGYLSSGIRSTSEEMFEKYCEDSSNVKWFYKNGEDRKKSFSIIYLDNTSKPRYFFPDYLVMTTEGKLWIVETKGGETEDKLSKDIDKNTSCKFEYLQEYARKYGCNFGFVRDEDSKGLVINNTKYVKELRDDNWVALNKVL